MRFNTRDVTALDEQIGYFVAVVGRVDDATVFEQEIGHWKGCEYPLSICENGFGHAVAVGFDGR